METVCSGWEMAGLPLKLVRPESRKVLGTVLALKAAGKCLCGGEKCQEPAAPGRRGLSESCYRAWHSHLLRHVAPSSRDPWERQEIRLGHILWPEQGQGKRKPRQRKPEAVAAEVAAKVNRRAKQRRRMERAAAKAKGGAA